MRTAKINKLIVLRHFALILLFLVAWLGVIPAQSESVSVVTFYVQ